MITLNRRLFPAYYYTHYLLSSTIAPRKSPHKQALNLPHLSTTSTNFILVSAMKIEVEEWIPPVNSSACPYLHSLQI